MKKGGKDRPTLSANPIDRSWLRSCNRYGLAPFFLSCLRSFALFDRTFADAAAAFFARSIRSFLVSLAAAALPPFDPPILPPLRPDSLKNSIISVIEPNVLFAATPQAYELERGTWCH